MVAKIKILFLTTFISTKSNQNNGTILRPIIANS